MSIICTRCGGTQVVCEATVNPNTKVITEISDDSLQFGRCETCKARSVLTDVEKTKAAIKSGMSNVSATMLSNLCLCFICYDIY